MELYKQYFNQEVKNMEYGRINWKNGSSGGTPFSAENLNIMDKGIDDAKKEINDTKSSKVSFTSNDSDDESAISWSSVDILTTGETHASILSKISKMFRNIRYLNKKYDQVNSDLSKSDNKMDVHSSNIKVHGGAIAYTRTDDTSVELKVYESRGVTLLLIAKNGDISSTTHMCMKLSYNNDNHSLTSISGSGASIVSHTYAPNTNTHTFIIGGLNPYSIVDAIGHNVISLL